MNEPDVLELRSVERRFGGIRAVQSVTLDIKRGERRAILGPNGAGKTTLFNLIAGDTRPTAGTVTFVGENITHLPAHRRARRGLSRTYQAAHCFGGLNVHDNLFLALRGTKPGRMSVGRASAFTAERDRASTLASEVGLGHALRTPVAVLSHGEQRQLELGMALAGNPRLLMLDEPAAGLSPGERSRLTELLLGLDATMTVLLIEHDMDVALRVAGVVTVMHDGTVLTTGSPDEIRSSQTVHDLYLGALGA